MPVAAVAASAKDDGDDDDTYDVDMIECLFNELILRTIYGNHD